MDLVHRQEGGGLAPYGQPVAHDPHMRPILLYSLPSATEVERKGMKLIIDTRDTIIELHYIE